MFVIIRSSILIYLVMLMTGCASTQALSPQDKQQLRSFTVNEKIIYPGQAYYMGPGYGLLIAGGAVSGVIEGTIAANKGAQLAEFATRNHIAIDQIVKEQLVHEIEKNTKLRMVKQNADAELKISISQYGFSIPTSYNFSVVPVLSVNAELVKNNQVIWKNNYSVRPLFSGMNSYSSKEVFNDPVKVKAAWTAAAQKVAANIAQTLS